MIDKAIQKINTEMQKDANDPYTEIIGHYIIDRCVDESVAAKILDERKNLKGAMEAILEKAKKARNGNVAVLTPNTVFQVVDKYFGFTENKAAQERVVPPGNVNAPKKKPAISVVKPQMANKVSLDLTDFL